MRIAPPATGVIFKAGEGVGIVTRPGLPLPPGEPAINPAPRAMIRANLEEVAERLGARADAIVEISVPGGEKIAERTANGRLGIVGGLSILGTTGVVIPYSCSAWIHSIHRGVDVARASGCAHIGAATGDVSEGAIRARYRLPDHALIDMGDFVGGLLKYLREHPVPRLTIAGGPAKMAKLAEGKLDLHSKRGAVDLAALAERVAQVGGTEALAARDRQREQRAPRLRACRERRASTWPRWSRRAHGRRPRACSKARRSSSRSWSSAAMGGCWRAADFVRSRRLIRPRFAGGRRENGVHSRVVELALAKVLRAERRADEDERGALDRRLAQRADDFA